MVPGRNTPEYRSGCSASGLCYRGFLYPGKNRQTTVEQTLVEAMDEIKTSRYQQKKLDLTGKIGYTNDD